MPKTPEKTSDQPQKTSQKNTTPKSADAEIIPNIWPADPERVFSNFYQAWQDASRSLMPTFGDNDQTHKPSDDAFGLAAWQEQTDRYFKGLNKTWLDLAKMSTFNVLAPINPMAMTAGVTITDKDGQFTVTAPLPGISEDDINVALDDGFLVISGNRTETSDGKDNGTQIHAWQSGTFRHLVRLPVEAVPEKIKAGFSKGVLTVTMPKTTTSQDQPRTIQING